MTLDQALTLKAGDHVTHPMAIRPMRVTETWINATKSIVLVRIASVTKDREWLDACGYDVTVRMRKAARDR